MDWNNPFIHSVLVIVAITIAFLSIMLLVAFTVLAERRVLAFIQGRVGPNRVGYGGVLQPFADFIKTMMKEDLVPDQSTKFVFLLAPRWSISRQPSGVRSSSPRPTWTPSWQALWHWLASARKATRSTSCGLRRSLTLPRWIAGKSLICCGSVRLA